MDHRTEQIMAAVEAVLTGLVTTGNNVERGRARDDAFEISTENALSIYQGLDNPESSSWPLLTVTLTTYVDIHVKTLLSAVDTRLNLIRKEITIALQNSNNLGLAFVADIEEGPASEPISTDASEKPTTSMRTVWTIKYSRNYQDPGN